MGTCVGRMHADLIVLKAARVCLRSVLKTVLKGGRMAQPLSSFRLLPLGDSITDGGAKLRSYRYHLHGLLGAADHRAVGLSPHSGPHTHTVRSPHHACAADHRAVWLREAHTHSALPTHSPRPPFKRGRVAKVRQQHAPHQPH